MYRQQKWKYFRTRTKYNNKRSEYNGGFYHSKFESKVAQDLDLKKHAGEIKSWERQVKISLDVNGYHICNYYMDFVITHNDGNLEYLEVKGFFTEVFKLKWKLFEALYKDKPDIILTVLKM
jgi:hypothetical protein